MRVLLACTLLFASVFAYDSPIGTKPEWMETNSVNSTGIRGFASCKDSDLTKILNNALGRYIHDMDGLTKYVLDQIVSYRKSGQWLVHAQVISSSRQGSDWQTTTNSQVFTGRDPYGCFYHDTMTYILVLRVY